MSELQKDGLMDPMEQRCESGSVECDAYCKLININYK